jgi:hypothetical protein
MTEPDCCERCKLPIIGSRVTFRLESSPARVPARALALCESCLDSLERWVERGQPPGPHAHHGHPAPRHEPSTRRKHKPVSGRRSRYVDELEREDSLIRYRMVLVVGSIVLTFTVFAALAIISLVHD